LKHTIILVAFAAFAAVPAPAQPVAADLMPAYEVATIVASMGMRPIGRPAWMRGRYVVAAIDRYGREVNVVLDARDGQVLAVRPLARNSFGAPPLPPGYGPRRAPYDPMDGMAPPPEAGPRALPPQDDGEFFDNDRQQGSMSPPRVTARPATRDPAVTGSIARSAPVTPKENAARDVAPKNATPMPRPRPALAKANDPGNEPTPGDNAAAAAAPAAKKPEAAKPDAKPEADKPAANVQATKPDAKAEPAAKPDQANKLNAKPEQDVRVIDLSKPKAAAKPEDKPGEAIRF
jgi:hypothetical protein